VLLPQVMWSAFGVIWDLRMFGLVGLEVEEVVNLCCDFSAKVSVTVMTALLDIFWNGSLTAAGRQQLAALHKPT
jgi:hypothetical protein